MKFLIWLICLGIAAMLTSVCANLTFDSFASTVIFVPLLMTLIVSLSCITAVGLCKLYDTPIQEDNEEYNDYCDETTEDFYEQIAIEFNEDNVERIEPENITATEKNTKETIFTQEETTSETVQLLKEIRDLLIKMK